MRAQYYPPTFNEKQFHCVFCGVFAGQSWYYVAVSPLSVNTHMKACVCRHCGGISYWYQERMLIPAEAPVEPAHPDLPADCLPEYNEARDIFARSPRASAALLRLCLQKLMIHLGEKGKNINDDIGSLVAKGLPVVVQRALDVCRVVGNNAVHPGEINLNDSPDVAQSLFQMINFIVEDRISRPAEVHALFDRLPEGAKQAIAKRDATAKLLPRTADGDGSA